MKGNHWRDFFDSPHLGSWDLPKGEDIVVVISKVDRGELKDQKGRNTKKALVYFEGKQKALAANVTNCKAIAAMYGTNPRQWIGKRIAMYVAENVDSPQGPVDAIRVRPRIPPERPANGRGRKNEAPPPSTTELPETSDASEEWQPEEPPMGALESDHAE